MGEYPIAPNGDGSYTIPSYFMGRGTYWVRHSEDAQNLKIVYTVTKEDLQRYFYEIEFSDLESAANFGIDAELLQGRFSAPEECGGMTTTERNLLYRMVRKIRPKSVLEFSPNQGRSTYTISKALQDEGITPEFFDTHEIEKRFVDETKAYLGRHQVPFVTVKQGDVFQTLDRNKLRTTDFLFIDSDHYEPFAVQYCEEFLPLLKKGAWVAVHDMRPHPSYKTGETAQVQQYLKRNPPAAHFHIADLLKHHKLAAHFDEFEHCARNTLFFFQV